MACFCVIISNSLSSYEGCRVASFCEKEYDRQSNNIVFCFFFCCHLPGMCHSLSKHFWQIPVFHCGHLRNSVIQWMRKHSINSWPALWNENSPFDFLPPYFFFFFHKHAACSALLGYIYWSILQVLYGRNTLLVIHSVFQCTTFGDSYQVWCKGSGEKGQNSVSPQL